MLATLTPLLSKTSEHMVRSLIPILTKSIPSSMNSFNVRTADGVSIEANTSRSLYFFPISYSDMKKRRAKIIELNLKSSYNYIIVSGCGPEHYMWAKIKSELKSNSKSF